MRFATLHSQGETAVARLDGDRYVILSATDVGDLFRQGLSNVSETGVTISVSEARLAPAVTAPRKVLCVGVNYKSHIREFSPDGALPTFPTLFAKWADTLIGPLDDIAVPAPEIAQTIDWEAELAIVIGRPLKRSTRQEASDGIGGYTVANDISMRDWQMRSTEWLQGKAWDATTPLGPVVVTPDEVDNAASLEISCDINGERKQLGNTSDLLFKPDAIVSYISTFTRLEPGDVILTGTTAGVGAATGQKVLLTPGDVVTTTILGIGQLINTVVAEAE